LTVQGGEEGTTLPSFPVSPQSYDPLSRFGTTGARPTSSVFSTLSGKKRSNAAPAAPTAATAPTSFRGETYVSPGGTSSLDTSGYYVDPTRPYQVKMTPTRYGTNAQATTDQEEQDREHSRRSMTQYLIYWLCTTFVILFGIIYLSNNPQTSWAFTKTFKLSKTGKEYTYASLLSMVMFGVGLIMLVFGLGAELQGANAINMSYSATTIVLVGIFLYMATFMAKTETVEFKSKSLAVDIREKVYPTSATSRVSSLTATTTPAMLDSRGKLVSTTSTSTSPSRGETKTISLRQEYQILPTRLERLMKEGKMLPFHIQSEYTIRQLTVQPAERKQMVTVPCRLLATSLNEEGREMSAVYIPEWAVPKEVVDEEEEEDDRIRGGGAEETTILIAFPILTIETEKIRPWMFLQQLDMLLKPIFEHSKEVSRLKTGNTLDEVMKQVEVAISDGMISSSDHSTSSLFAELVRKHCSNAEPDSAFSVDQEIFRRDSSITSTSSSSPASTNKKATRKVDNIYGDVVFGGTGFVNEDEMEEPELSWYDTMTSPNEEEVPEPMEELTTTTTRKPESTQRDLDETRMKEDAEIDLLLLNGFCLTSEVKTTRHLQSWKNIVAMIDSYQQTLTTAETYHHPSSSSPIDEVEEENDPELVPMTIDTDSPSETLFGEQNRAERLLEIDASQPVQSNQPELRRFLVDIFSKLSFIQQRQENIVSLTLAFYSLIAINLFVPLVSLDESSSKPIGLKGKLETVISYMFPIAKLFWLVVPSHEDMEETVVNAVQQVRTMKQGGVESLPEVCDIVLSSKLPSFVSSLPDSEQDSLATAMISLLHKEGKTTLEEKTNSLKRALKELQSRFQEQVDQQRPASTSIGTSPLVVANEPTKVSISTSPTIPPVTTSTTTPAKLTSTGTSPILPTGKEYGKTTEQKIADWIQHHGKPSWEEKKKVLERAIVLIKQSIQSDVLSSWNEDKPSSSTSPFEQSVEEIANEKKESENVKPHLAKGIFGRWSKQGKISSVQKQQTLQQALHVFQQLVDPTTYQSLYENPVLTSTTYRELQEQQQLRVRQAAMAQRPVSQFANYQPPAASPSSSSSSSSSPEPQFFRNDEIAFGGKYTLNQRIFQSALASLLQPISLTPEEKASDQYQQMTADEQQQALQDRNRAVLLHVYKVMDFCMQEDR
jgi:hypothetical protein